MTMKTGRAEKIEELLQNLQFRKRFKTLGDILILIQDHIQQYFPEVEV